MNPRSIRPFIGAADFETSRKFYTNLGFQESAVAHNLSYFHIDGFGFYLQDAYVKDWVDNTMVFMEVVDVEQHWEALTKLDLTTRFTGVRLTPIKTYEWGRECFLHDPSGILWHFGEFTKFN
jgi:hypothetical protein